MTILSIQSHVAFGHVGNAAATFPLQRLGFDVWPVHTVMFSNHTGYDDYGGPVIDAAEVRAVIDGLERRGVLAECEAVLSGFLGSAAIGDVVRETVGRVRHANPAVLYVCDPVIGDTGDGVYVDPGIPDLLRRIVLAEADIAMPNQFELEVLTGRSPDSLGSQPPSAIIEAARQLLRAADRLRLVLVSSVRHRETSPDSVEMFAVAAANAWRVTTPALPFVDPLSGAGDAVSALFAGHYLRSGGDVALALGAVASSVFAVLETTVALRRRELALVAAQEALLHPPRCFVATPID